MLGLGSVVESDRHGHRHHRLESGLGLVFQEGLEVRVKG
jgi:hypothetical protein